MPRYGKKSKRSVRSLQNQMTRKSTISHLRRQNAILDAELRKVGGALTAIALLDIEALPEEKRGVDYAINFARNILGLNPEEVAKRQQEEKSNG